jgi:putative ABC transport system ATP-binding protein
LRELTGRALLGEVAGARRRRIVAAASLLAVHQGCEVLVPVVVGATLDAAVAESDTAALLRWLAILVVLFTALSFAYRFGARIAEATTEHAAHALRLRAVERVVDPRGGGEGGRLPGELLSIATADVDAAADIVRVLTFGAGLATALVAGAVVLLLTSPTLGLVVLVGLPPVVWLGGRLGVVLTRRAADQQAGAATAAGVATDLVGGLRVLQGIGGSGPGAARYRSASRASLAATLSAARTEAAFEAGAVLVSGVALAGVALVGGRLAARGELSIGELVAAAGVTQFLVGPLSTLGWAASTVARAQASSVRLAAALAASPAVAVPAVVADAPTGPGALTLRGLSAGPLAGLDLDVPGGTTCGLAVGDPAAAVALLACLGREAEPDAGEMLVDGVALTGLEPAVARATVVVSPHDAALLADTVMANVAATAAADPGAVERAIAAAAVHDVVAALPHGLQTRLTDAGRSLSGGQRQRIALARALAAPAPVLVLHEPTTALDAATEARVAAALRGARGARTTLLVTTSPALLAVCDMVVLVCDGRAPVADTHARLLDDAGYRAVVLG